jgi:malonyl-CoA O-methyltransferase
VSGRRKAQVARAFSQAAGGYDAAAAVQREVAARLAASILEGGLPAGPRVLEVGCGTGFLSRALLAAVPGGHWLLTDIAPTMLERCREALGDEPRAVLRAMDGEHPDVAEGSFDAVVSSLTLQWFEDLGAGLGRLARCLVPGGRLFFATLGCGTFAEWRAAHARLGLQSGGLALPDPQRFPWPAGGRGVLREERLVARHTDGRAFLHSLKAIGAHLPAAGRAPLTAWQLRAVLRELGVGCSATYHVLYGCFERERAG